METIELGPVTPASRYTDHQQGQMKTAGPSRAAICGLAGSE